MYDMPLPAPTVVARVATDEARAGAILNLLGETLDIGEVATAAFEEPDGRWIVSLHFRDQPDEAALRALVEMASDAETAQALTFDSIAATDWVKASLEGLKPVEAGRFLVHGAHDRAKVPPHRIGIEIEAALAFGTGHHGTTRGCLIAFDDLLKRRRTVRQQTPTLPLQGGGLRRGSVKQHRGLRPNVLDVGTGTGVLAFAAAKALRRPVLGSDIDARSVLVARENARLNHVGAYVELIHTAGLGSGRFRSRAPFDLIFANILLAPLKRLSQPIGQLAARNGRIILSGLLPAHANAAISAYRTAGLVLERRRVVDGWVTLTLRRRRA